MPPAKTATTCPNCGAGASGRFCSECGAALEGAACAACRTPLTPGAQFCHRCAHPVGAPVGAAPRLEARAPAGPPESRLPWMVALVAVVGVAALVIVQTMNRGASASSATAQTLSPADAGATGAPGGAQGGAPGGMPSAGALSAMSPRERADRLFDRVMRLSEEGKRDSVAFFAPMAVAAYQMVEPLDADARYDMGRVAEVGGDVATARAQADTILRAQPTHLLGLILGARAAELANDDRARQDFRRRFTAALSAERAKNLPEYQRHASDIEAAEKGRP